MNEWIFLTPLQSVLQSTTRMTFQTTGLDHATRLIKTLPWFLVVLRTNPRLLTMGLAHSQTSSFGSLLPLMATHSFSAPPIHQADAAPGLLHVLFHDLQDFFLILPWPMLSPPLSISSCPASSQIFQMTPFTEAPDLNISLSQTSLVFIRTLLADSILFIFFLNFIEV